VPQLIENYKQGSADAISFAFLLVWFLGDVTNLAGAVWSGLVPTVIALAVYFCFADFTLISQVLYYRVVQARRRRRRREAARKLSARSAASGGTEGDDEERPLLDRRNSRSSDNTGLPGSHRRKSSGASRRHRDSVNRRDSLASIVEEESGGREWLTNLVSILGVCVIGAAGWAAAWRTGAWTPTPTDGDAAPVQMAVGAQILGYVSAVCYLG
jgi:solute carrier family 66 (lysosomal lysine-arginine transporter), member 1